MGNPNLPQVKVTVTGFMDAADIVKLLPKVKRFKSWGVEHGKLDLILDDQDTKKVLHELTKD